MQIISNENFCNETIGFDGFQFISCCFTNCVIIITTLEFDFEHCSFYDSAIHVNPNLPIFEISHRLSQSSYDSNTNCFRDNYEYPRSVVKLPVSSSK